MHALLIGIDQYKSSRLETLEGAVADADAMGRLLRDTLHVPESQIVYLRNAQATRAAIMQHIRALRTRATLCAGDPILIYFAGHGVTVAAASKLDVLNAGVSTILPYDVLPEGIDDHGTLHGISSHTLDTLLREIARDGKGDNIVSNISRICIWSSSERTDCHPRLLQHRLQRQFCSRRKRIGGWAHVPSCCITPWT